MNLPDPTFPPLLSGHAVKAPAVPFDEACRGAASGALGAGDIVWARALDRVRMALVLEPDVPRIRSREILFVAMVAAGDAIGALIPPEVAITWDWPDVLLTNGARIGGIDFALSESAHGDEGESRDVESAPDWLVVGLDVALRPQPHAAEPGHDPDRTTLFDEGCGELDRTHLVEAWSRHLLAWIDTWQQEGFRPVHDAWMFRAHRRNETLTMKRDGTTLRGTFIGLDDHGGLLLKGEEGTVLVEVRDAASLAAQ